MNKHTKKGMTEKNEQIKKISFIFSGVVYQCTWSQSCDKGKSWNITDFIDSICAEPSFSIDTGKFYDHFQYSSDHIADSDSEKEL